MTPPLQKIIDRVQGNEERIWVFCGDSITHGAYHTFGRRDYVELVQERVRAECGKTLHLFVNSGINGDTTVGILEKLNFRVIQFQPDVFSLMIGMNDSRNLPLEDYEKNLREIVSRVRAETSAEVLLQTCCAIHPKECPQRLHYPEFMDACRRVAADMETALIDHHVEWEKVRITDRATFASWMDNEFHPGALGHWVFADKILRDLELGPIADCSPPA